MCVVQEPWPEECETLPVVYLEHIISGFRQQQVERSHITVTSGFGEPQIANTTVTALGIVGLNALGPENCLLMVRVCRGVCADPVVHEASRRKLLERQAFEFVAYSGRKVGILGWIKPA